MKKHTFLGLAVSTILLAGCGGGSSSGNTLSHVDDSGGSSSGGSSSALKIYQYQSARIIYDTSSTFSVGSFSTESRGTETLVFRDWGNEEVEKSEQEITITSVSPSTGQTTTTTDTKRELRKWLTPKSYSVNYEKERITINDFSEIIALSQTNPDALAQIFGGLGEGVVKTGTSEVLGIPCDVYKIGDVGTNCIHKDNIVLSATLGNSGESTKIATSIEFDIDVDESELALPNYPTVEF